MTRNDSYDPPAEAREWSAKGVDILTHRYTRICGSEGMFERSGHQSGHTGLRTPVLIPKLSDLLRSGILMDRTVLSPESYCNAGSSSTDPITLC